MVCIGNRWKWPIYENDLMKKTCCMKKTWCSPWPWQTQERSFKTVYNLMIKEKTITNCRFQQREDNPRTDCGVYYICQNCSSQMICFAWTIKPNVFGGAKLKICIYFELRLLLHCVLTCFEGFFYFVYVSHKIR